MSKRTLPRQTSIASFLKPKSSKSGTTEQAESCPSCNLDASGSNHLCFACSKRAHAFCCNLETPIEGFGKPILCKAC